MSDTEIGDRGSGIGSEIADRRSARSAIDRAVREMLDVEPPAGLRGRVLDRIERPSRGSAFTTPWLPPSGGRSLARRPRRGRRGDHPRGARRPWRAAASNRCDRPRRRRCAHAAAPAPHSDRRRRRDAADPSTTTAIGLPYSTPPRRAQSPAHADRVVAAAARRDEDVVWIDSLPGPIGRSTSPRSSRRRPTRSDRSSSPAAQIPALEVRPHFRHAARAAQPGVADEETDDDVRGARAGPARRRSSRRTANDQQADRPPKAKPAAPAESADEHHAPATRAAADMVTNVQFELTITDQAARRPGGHQDRDGDRRRPGHRQDPHVGRPCAPRWGCRDVILNVDATPHARLRQQGVRGCAPR